jgi:CRISPR system Cascade subunit CasA
VASFDLLTQPWIPVTRRGQRVPSMVSLQQALSAAHDIDDIAVQSPLVYVALVRLMLAILHRGYRGPRNHREWRDIWRRGRIDMALVARYFTIVSGRFDLFDPVFPFYQAPRMPATFAPKPARALEHRSTAFGATVQMYGGSPAEAQEPISAAYAALLLITFQQYHLGGTVSREVGTRPSALGAPLAKAAVLVVKGGNFFETLVLNLSKYEPLDEDRPAWERAAPERGTRACHGWVDYLTWQCRRLLLAPPTVDDTGRLMVSQVRVADGWDAPKGEAAREVERMCAFRIGEKKQWHPFALDVDRSAWRNLTALFVASDKVSPPKSLEWLRELIERRDLDGDRPWMIDVQGMVTFQYRILDWRRERVILPPGTLDRSGVAASIALALAIAEAAGSTVRYLAGQMGAEELSLANYWFSLSQPFNRWLSTLADMGDADAQAEWRAVVIKTAWRVWHEHSRHVSLMQQVTNEGHVARALNVALKKVDQRAGEIGELESA